MNTIGALAGLGLIIVGIGAPFALDRHLDDLIITVLIGGVGFMLGVVSVGFDKFLLYCFGLAGVAFAAGVIYLNLWVKPKQRIGDARIHQP